MIRDRLSVVGRVAVLGAVAVLAWSPAAVYGGYWSTSEADGLIEIEEDDDFGDDELVFDYSKGRFTASRTQSTAHVWAGADDASWLDGATTRNASGDAKGSKSVRKQWVTCTSETSPAGSYSVTIAGDGDATSKGQYDTAFGLNSAASNSGRAGSSGGGSGGGVGTPNTGTVSDVGADDEDGGGGLQAKGTKVPDQASNGVEATLDDIIGATSDWSRHGKWTVSITGENVERPAGTNYVTIYSQHSCCGTAQVSAKGDVGTTTSTAEADTDAESNCEFSMWQDNP